MTKEDAKAEIQRLQQTVAAHQKQLNELIMRTENLKGAIESLRRQSDGQVQPAGTTGLPGRARPLSG